LGEELMQRLMQEVFLRWIERAAWEGTIPEWDLRKPFIGYEGGEGKFRK